MSPAAGWQPTQAKSSSLARATSCSVPVGQHALAAIAAWLAKRPEWAARQATVSDAHALFLGPRGARITPRAIQLRLKAHAQMLGIPVDVHPHVLRHSFASHVLQIIGRPAAWAKCRP